MRPAVWLASAALVVASTSACDGDPKDSPDADPPSLLPTACPPEVDDVLMSGYTCETLTITPGEEDPVRLLVTKIEPPGGPTHDDPLVGIGPDLATTFNYAGLAPAAERTGRTLLLVNPRGVSGSQPDLDCPEAEEATTDEGWQQGVAACADRLTEDDVDLDAFNQSAMAADVIALTSVLGLDQWNLGSWGTSGRVALEVLRADPPGLRSVFLDSPELPSDNPLTTAAGDTRAALRRVLDDCAADRACRALPHRMADVERIVDELDRDPLTRRVRTADGQADVTVDGVLVVRLLRHMLATGSSVSQYSTAGAVPALLHALEHDAGMLDDTLLAPMAASRPNCEGYLPSCQPYHRVSIGAFLSAICPATGPAEDAAPADAIGRAYARNPYVRACADWPVEARAFPGDPVVSEVPVLVAVGRYNPYVDVDRLRAGLSGLARLELVVVPAWGYNALGSGPCLSEIRNAFVDDPDAAPDDTCVDDLPSRAEFRPRL